MSVGSLERRKAIGITSSGDGGALLRAPEPGTTDFGSERCRRGADWAAHPPIA